MESNEEVPGVYVRMFKTGTGDFFLIRFRNEDSTHFNILLDCGSFHFDKILLQQILEEIGHLTENVIDLLIVTHEHSDHINGFDLASSSFSKLTIKSLWLAWTEDPNDPFANTIREDFSKMRMTISNAFEKLSRFLHGENFKNQYQGERNYTDIISLRDQFISGMTSLNEINENEFDVKGKSNQTLIEKFKLWGLIKPDTRVEFREPGEILKDIIPGMTFFILGPPKSIKALNDEGRTTDYYKKREKPSEFAGEWMNALDEINSDIKDLEPFDKQFFLNRSNPFTNKYYHQDIWRKIDEDWLMNVGNVAIKFERCLNNTSLAFAIQSDKTKNVMLFPGDAEYGNWNSWQELKWQIDDDKTKEINVEYLLSKTVFYKVGHHLSQNGTPKKNGIDFFPSSNFTAMASLDLDNIHPIWKNTMPCKDLTAELIIRSKGNIYFSGDYKRILQNIDNTSVSIPSTYIKHLKNNHEKFNDLKYLEVSIQ